MTTKEDFYLADGSIKKVDMMKSDKEFRYMRKPGGIDADICELPYVGDKLSMAIILPRQGQLIEDVQKKLNDSILSNIMRLELPFEEINLQIPKFKLEFKSEVFIFK